MYSIAFPDIFSTSKLHLVSDINAVKNNLKLVLLSNKTELFGDPDYGCNLKRFLYEPNNSVIYDLIRQEIYDAILIYVPQIRTSRDSIELTSDGTDLYATIKYNYMSNRTPDMFTIKLTEE